MNAPLIVAHNACHFLGGAELWTIRLLSALRERGYRVLVLSRDRSMAANFERHGLEARVAYTGGQLALHHALTFGNLLRRLQPTGLLLTTFKKIWLAGMGASLAGVPRVVARIGLSTDLPSRHWTYQTALRRWVHQTVVNSDGIRLPFLEALGDYDPEKVITVYNGVIPPVRERAQGAVRAELGIAPGASVVGTVARLDIQKRLDRLLDAVSRLGPHTHCIIAGEGDERDSLVEQAGRLGIRERLHLLGHRQDVGDVLAAMDLFVLASDREGMSNAMLEAMSAAVPVLSTPVSGAAEALASFPDGSVPGVVVPPDAQSIAREVSALLSSPGRLETMGQAGRQRARERFEFTQKVDTWAALLAGDAEGVRHEGPSELRPFD